MNFEDVLLNIARTVFFFFFNLSVLIFGVGQGYGILEE
jgi:hypothetical protein